MVLWSSRKSRYRKEKKAHTHTHTQTHTYMNNRRRQHAVQVQFPLQGGGGAALVHPPKGHSIITRRGHCELGRHRERGGGLHHTVHGVVQAGFACFLVYVCVCVCVCMRECVIWRGRDRAILFVDSTFLFVYIKKNTHTHTHKHTHIP